jgi:hypothetical protein
MKNFLRNIFGIDKIEAETEEAIRQKVRAELAAEKAVEAERLAKLNPKDAATEKKEPWVAVLDTKVNPDNVRNGFFELDWNEYFVLQLKEAGYKGDSEEAIVDAWFQELCRNVGAEANVNMDRRGSGFINVNKLGDGKVEVS